ncbi:MAG: MFS transporter [Pseudomonadota bacterium]
MTELEAPAAGAAQPAAQRWIALGLACAIFFVATGGAFSSLGVMLPSMIEELSLSWAQAGASFTVLALLTGLSSTVPATTIKIGGLPLVYATGGVVIAAGFALLGITQNITTLLIGAGLVGLGYSQVGAVPAVKLLGSLFTKRRSLTIGVFFTCGALGSVAGPQIASAYIEFTPSWRGYWLMVAAVILGLNLLTAAFMRSSWIRQQTGGDDAGNTGEEADGDASDMWQLREVLYNPQYYIIVLGVTATLLGALTMNTWQVTHMQNLGVASVVAANALSAHALFNAFSRIFGGFVADRVGAKMLFVTGLAAGVLGMAALSVADSTLLIALFAFGDGFGFGIVTFSSTILLIQFYGVKHSPAILGVLNLITTVAMVGPIMAGSIGERLGGFAEVFAGFAVLMLICTIAAAVMPTPRRAAV